MGNNPMFREEVVKGGVVINALLLGYVLPALLCMVLSWAWSRPQWTGRSEGASGARFLTFAAGATAILLGFVYLALEAHVMVLGNESQTYFRSSNKSYAISAVWLLYGLALLAGGIALRNRGARLGSAIIILIVTAKVFLIDMQDLEGVWRALSFIGLGATLIGIGLVYQRFLFRKPTASSMVET